jgi:hypothetical protein
MRIYSIWIAFSPMTLGIIKGGRDMKYICRWYPISNIDIAYSEIGQRFVGPKAFGPISDQSDYETV